MDTSIPEFKLAWAKIVARASTDTAFRARLSDDAGAVFAEYGFGGDKDELTAFVGANLQPALDAIAQQHVSQEQAARTASAGAAAFYTSGCGGDPCATQASALPCWVRPMLQGGGIAGDLVGSTDFGARFNCWGSAACVGSAGSYCGTAGTIGTGGTFGCGGGAQMQSTALSGATQGPVSGGCAGTFGTYGGTAGTVGCAGAAQQPGGTMAGARFNCVGSVGTAGCVGSMCGTAGSAATVGTFGCAVQQVGATAAEANASSTSGATLGSFATYCGCIGGGSPQISPSSACWGTSNCV